MQKIGVTDNDKYTFCGEFRYNTCFFYRCQHTNSLWRNLKENIYNNTHKVVNSTEETVIFGVNPPSDILNCIILYTKAYIYKINKSKGQVNIYGLLNFMRDTYENEKYASKMNLKLELFENKWNLWKDFL